MKVYLDNCCFNRPYDEQTQETIRLESEAKLFIQELIRSKQIMLVWSFILDFENDANPYKNQKETIAGWKQFSVEDVQPLEQVLQYAKEISLNTGVKSKDSIHLASAIFSHCSYFLTTDKELIRRARSINEIAVINPIDFVRIREGNNEK